MSNNDGDKFPIRVGNAIVCEAIRVELGGKHSLLGVFPGDVVVNEFQNFLSISIFIELFAREIGPVHLDAIISYAETDLVQMAADFDFKNLRDPALITTPPFPLPLTGPGIITVRATCRDQKRNLLEKEIRAYDALRDLNLSAIA